MTNIQTVKKSSNSKIGKIPATTSARATCPPACQLAGAGGCYAEAGFYTRLNWDKIDSGERGGSFAEFLAFVENLKPGQLWRHNVAGDLAGAKNKIHSLKLRALVSANTGRRGFTYTHYPIRGNKTADANRHNIEKANRAGFTVNISANNPTEAQEIKNEFPALPVVSVVPSDFWEGEKRRENFVRCPAEYLDSVNCESCQLCQRRDRADIVGFTAHGTRAAAAEIIAKG